MGVKTYYWGKPGWAFIHICAYLLDVSKSQHETVFWFCITKALPCVYCRKSAGIFLESIYSKPIDNKRFAYLLHQEVNLKLFTQELMASEYDAISLIINRWSSYQPKISSVVYLQPNSTSCYTSVIKFFYAILCDYDIDRHEYIIQVFVVTTDIFKGTLLGDSLTRAFHEVGPLAYGAMLDDRLNYMFRIDTIAKQSYGKIPSESYYTIMRRCKNSIVDCKI
jgi:hypothetical protein